MGQYLPILIMLILGAGFAGSSLVMSKLVSPKRPSAAKAAPYECGIVPRNQPPERFPVRFYLVAMIFIVFDIEIIFLYPYAVIFRELGVFGLVEMLVFAVAVFASFLFLIANGALDWGPVQRLRRASPAVDSGRTATSTVRRVGAEGRPARRPEEVAA
ncbi:MAG TPA: NADH-quinone oxidoreductase subunit A [Aquihabitans sp.]|jgi:NADH-quinone oxidoreductase subunit A|nr:NADH-quinone oxidoreductase subunit A [Aquihabitans sp.]